MKKKVSLIGIFVVAFIGLTVFYINKKFPAQPSGEYSSQEMIDDEQVSIKPNTDSLLGEETGTEAVEVAPVANTETIDGTQPLKENTETVTRSKAQPANQAVIKSNKAFKVFNAIQYRETPDLSEYGIHNIFMFYEGYLLDNDPESPKIYSKRTISEQKLKQHALKAKASPSIPVCLDIESWGLEGEEKDNSLSKYLQVLKIFRKYNDVSKIGYFGIFPLNQPLEKFYLTKKKDKKMYTNWLEGNKFINPVAEAIDVAYPSFYAKNDDTEAWLEIVKEKVSKIRQMRNDVKIYAIIWPQFATSDGLYKFIDKRIWNLQLETLYEYCDGIVIWTHYNGPDGKRINFNPDMPWFQQTLQFMEKYNIK